MVPYSVWGKKATRPGTGVPWSPSFGAHFSFSICPRGFPDAGSLSVCPLEESNWGFLVCSLALLLLVELETVSGLQYVWSCGCMCVSNTTKLLPIPPVNRKRGAGVRLAI